MPDTIQNAETIIAAVLREDGLFSMDPTKCTAAWALIEVRADIKRLRQFAVRQDLDHLAEALDIIDQHIARRMGVESLPASLPSINGQVLPWRGNP